MTRRTEPARKEPTSPARITCQFRAKQSMVYELDCGLEKVVLTMSGEPPPGGQWQAGAGFRRADAEPPLCASGASRGEALTAVAVEWTRMVTSAGYPQLDWAAIRTALAAVRAV